MFHRVAVAVVIAAFALGPSRAESQSKDELQLDMTFKTPSFKSRRAMLALNGSCALPDGIILKLTLNKADEMWSANQIIPQYAGAGGGAAEMSGKRFVYTAPIDGPGKYVATVELLEDFQERNLVAELRKRAGEKRKYQREFLIWGDDLVANLPPRLDELNALVAECREMVKQYERATMSKAGWTGEAKQLTQEGSKLVNKLQAPNVMTYYPAALNNLSFTLRGVVMNSQYFSFSADGKFSGASDYHANDKKLSTFRGEDYNWENIKRYVEETATIAGREFCLWIVKDLRRTGGQMRPDILDAIKSLKSAPGIDFYQERLQKATISEIDALEAEIRGVKK